MDLEKIEENLGTQQIDWKFIFPGTPHQGGAWERLIIIAKRILYSLSGTQKWTQQTFNTFICQVEGNMNSKPHYGKVSAAKPGKIRRIANAAAVFNGTCLNDHLLPGPDLLNDLVGIILRSREKPIIITADIEGFFLHVGVRKEDRKFLQFLWNDDFNKSPKEFEYQ